MHSNNPDLRRRWLLVLAALAMLVPAAGCSNRDVAPVSGCVTLKGEPQAGIYIYFGPIAPPKGDPLNAGMPSFARTDTEGRYTLRFMDDDREGALIATHNITMDDERTFGNGRGADNVDAAIPVKVPLSRVPTGWKSTFVVEPGGTAEANFELGKR